MAQSATSRTRKAAPPVPTPALIPDKLYFRISEVSELTQTKPYVLRYWETQFPRLKPNRTRSKHRLYRRKDVETILEIKRLLYEKGFTIEGARRALATRAKEPGQQQGLFGPTFDGAALGSIRRELESILTMLSRKC